MVNPVKFLRLMWYMRKVPGGYAGDANDVVNAFILAGVFKKEERTDAVQELLRQRIAAGFRELARRAK